MSREKSAKMSSVYTPKFLSHYTSHLNSEIRRSRIYASSPRRLNCQKNLFQPTLACFSKELVHESQMWPCPKSRARRCFIRASFEPTGVRGREHISLLPGVTRSHSAHRVSTQKIWYIKWMCLLFYERTTKYAFFTSLDVFHTSSPRVDYIPTTLPAWTFSGYQTIMS